jgi:hypothetical protein
VARPAGKRSASLAIELAYNSLGARLDSLNPNPYMQAKDRLWLLSRPLKGV